MEEEMETKAEQPSAIMGLLLAPLAVLLALATTKVVGIEYDLTLNNMMPMLVVAIASMLALVPRIVWQLDPTCPLPPFPSACWFWLLSVPKPFTCSPVLTPSLH